MAGLVHHFLEESARKAPEKTALLFNEKTATYQEVDSLAGKVASLLRHIGISQGERILMIMENSLESVAGYYGILKAGCVCVEVPDKSTLAEAAYYIANSGARICILSKGSARRLSDIDIEFVLSPESSFSKPNITCFTWDEVYGQDEDPDKVMIKEDDLASIVYTSGSTGRPKGVMLSHKNLFTNTASIVSYLGLSSTDRIMAVLPFYYVYGKTLLNTHFMVGGSVVINNRFAFPNSVIQDMVDKEVTGFAGVPSTFAILLNRSIFAKTKIKTLRYVTQAGGAMAPALTKRVLEHIGDASLYIMYGATEASARLTYLPPERLLDDKLGSIGIPIPNVTITIRDNEGNALAPFEVGNICATGDNIMQGYWRDKEETDRVLKPWGLVTGDLGHMDDQGFIFLTGRIKEMLKIGGERVSPKEIEDAIIESHLVHEAAVVGRPDEFLSEVPAAFIVPIDEMAFDLDHLKSFIKERLSVHKQPKYWNIIKTLPKKPSGKIDKGALKQ
ncbi:MAG TPA: AMP-dependent synthetase [Deltaproteobacteria bacterium]|nr:AMP-dependent synthetase [Deltaproteobacteria bacterium]